MCKPVTTFRIAINTQFSVTRDIAIGVLARYVRTQATQDSDWRVKVQCDLIEVDATHEVYLFTWEGDVPLLEQESWSAIREEQLTPDLRSCLTNTLYATALAVEWQ